MKGSTHFVIGAALGSAGALYYRMDFQTGALCVAVAAFSALSADLDGRSVLSSKLSKTSKFIRESIFGLGFLLLASVLYFYLIGHTFYPYAAAAASSVFLLGCVLREGIIRNFLLSVIGCGLMYWGWAAGMYWLAGLGLFVAWAPWLKHRGMTHTVWAVLFWGAISWGLERQIAVEGIALVSVAGYLSHLVADSLTPGGVKWLFPLYKKSIRLPRFLLK